MLLTSFVQMGKKTPKGKRTARAAARAAQAKKDADKQAAAVARKALDAQGLAAERDLDAVLEDIEVDEAASGAASQHDRSGDDEERQDGDDEKYDPTLAKLQAGHRRDMAAMEKRMLALLMEKRSGSGRGLRSNFSDVSSSDGEDTREVLETRRVQDAGPDKRLKGGQDRLQGRKAGFRRVFGRDLNEKEVDRLDRAFETGSKVSSSHFARSGSLSRTNGRGRRFGRPASLVTDLLVDEGELPPVGDADRTMAGMFEMFRKQSAKDGRKQVKKYQTFKAWYARYSEMGFVSREMLDQDPDTYWCFDWHLKCVLHVMAEYDWATAAAYHERVVKRWDRLDLEGLAYGDDATCGDWEAAVHIESLHAVQLKAKAKWSGRDSSDKHCKPCGKHHKAGEVCPKADKAKKGGAG